MNLETCRKKLEKIFLLVFIFCEACQNLLGRPLLPDYLLTYSNSYCDEKENENSVALYLTENGRRIEIACWIRFASEKERIENLVG